MDILASEILAFCTADRFSTYGIPMGLFLAGLFGGLTHCTLMCGPFVVAQSGEMKKWSDFILIPYHVGRLLTYTILAVLFSSVLNSVFLFLPIRQLVIAPILMIAGLVFIAHAFPQVARVIPQILNMRFGIPTTWIESGYQHLSSGHTPLKRLMLGLLLGLMPCGLATSAILISSTAPTILQSALSMLLFGLGTMPSLICAAYGGRILRIKFPNIYPKLTRGAMIWSGLWLFLIASLILI